MSRFALELLDATHDRKAFESGLEPIDSLGATGGIGMVVDAATDELIAFYEKFGFRRVSPGSLRLFLPTRSLVDQTED